MSLNKLLFALFLLSSPLGYAASSQPPAMPIEQPAPSSQADPMQPLQAKPSDQAPTPLPSSAEVTTSYEGAFIRMLITLLGLLFLVFATFWVMRRLGAGKFKIGLFAGDSNHCKEAFEP